MAKPRVQAWLSLALVLTSWTVAALHAAVDGSPWDVELLFLFLIIPLMMLGVVGAIRSAQYWPARFALLLVCIFVILPPIMKQLRPDPFPSFGDQISDGMAIEQVKEILGEPVKSKRLSKFEKVQTEATLRDEDGNPIDPEHLAKLVDADLLLHFKVRGTTVVVRFDEENRVKSFHHEFDFP